MSFLPNDVVVPVAGNENYMKLVKGENRFRVLGSAIVGYEYWNTENKPVRSRTPFAQTPNIKVNDQGKEVVNYFWAFPVFDYGANKIKILQLSQKTVQLGMMNYTEDPDWGEPMGYDMSIIRTEENGITKYAVKAFPHKPVSQEIKMAYDSMIIDLNELYKNGDPFKGSKNSPELNTPAMQAQQDITNIPM